VASAWRRLAVAAVAGAALWAAQGMPAAAAFPAPTGYVNDFAHVLDPASQATLDRRLAAYDQATGNQIAIAIFQDLGGAPIDDFSARLEEAWKVGRRGKDNGVLVVVALRERAVRIEVGYGLEPKITDADAGAIIRDDIAPAFRAGRYADGLGAAVDALQRLIGAPASSAGQTSVPASPAGHAAGGIGLLPLALFGAFLAFSLLAGRRHGRRCPRCGAALVAAGASQAGALGTLQFWTCPRCGYREKHLLRGPGSGMFIPWMGGPGIGWGSGGFAGGGGFGGFGGGASGGGGATGGW